MKDIPGFEGLYAVTKDGRVFSKRRNKFLSPGTTTRGYNFVFLGAGNNRMIAKLVLETFLRPLRSGEYIDHINRVKSDNRIENLRIASHIDNQRNKAKMNLTKPPSSRFKGVYKHTVNTVRPWIARIKSSYKYVHIGCYSTEEEAASAYDKTSTELFGEFALTNKALGLLK